jgi:hypothetical protein
VDFINDRNAHFNKKINRAFGQYTQVGGTTTIPNRVLERLMCFVKYRVYTRSCLRSNDSICKLPPACA